MKLYIFIIRTILTEGHYRLIIGNKRRRFLGALSTSANTADAIINSGPWEADANPIQVNGGGGRMP